MDDNNKHYMHQVINDYYQIIKKAELPADPERINMFLLELCDGITVLAGETIAFPQFDELRKDIDSWYKKYKMEVSDADSNKNS